MEDFTPVPGFLFRAWQNDIDGGSCISLKAFNDKVKDDLKLGNAIDAAEDAINEELDGDTW